MKHARTVLLVLAAAAALLAVSFGTWRFLSAGASRYTDAQTIRVPARQAPLRQILWQPAARVRDSRSTNADEYEPRVSADGTLMVFVRGRPGANADLWSSRWTPDGWTPPEPIAAVNTPSDELGPELSRDGASLFFYSDRPGGAGGHDIWISRRAANDWADPVSLGPAVNSAFNEYGPALTPDGAGLYFSSNRPRAGEPQRTRDDWPATLREPRERHDYDLYFAALSAGSAAPASPIESLNTPFDEGAPAVSPVGDFVYFASDRPGGFGGFDVLRSRRLRGAHAASENLGLAVNSDANELDPALSMEGFRLYFSSDRSIALDVYPPPAPEPASSPAHSSRYALWTSASREVFLEAQPSRAWSSLLTLIGLILPWLLSLLLALALLWLLRRMLGIPGLRRGMARLSLLAQCVLLSVLIHALLASLLAIWRVGSQIGGLLNEGGGSQVILTSSGDSGGVAGQLRAELFPALSLAPDVVLTRSAPEQSTLDSRQALIAPQVETGWQDPTSDSPTALESRSDPEPAIAPQVTAQLPTNPGFTPELLPDSEPVAAADEPRAGPIEVSPTDRGGQSALQPPVLASATRATVQPTLALSPVTESPAGDIGAPELSATDDTSAPPVMVSAIPETRTGGAQLSGVGLPASASPGGGATEPSAPPLPLATSSGSPRGAVNVRAILSDAGLAIVPSPARSGIDDRADKPTLTIAGAPSGPPAEPRGQPSLPADRSGIAAAPVRLPGVPTTNATPGGIAAERNAPVAPLVSSASRAPASIAVPQLGRESRAVMTPGSSTSATSGADHAAPFTPRATGRDLSASLSRPSPTLPDAIAGATSSIRLPSVADIPIPAETFAQRTPEIREGVLERMGGSAETERAVTLALDWFKTHQHPDGRWSGRHFDDGCGNCGGAAEIDSDAAITGITLLCFLSAGHTHATDGPYRDLVGKALDWLLARQSASGDLRRGETMYSHDLVTVALCEAFAMTRDPRIGEAARRAVSFMLAAQSESGSAGRTARERAEATSVLGWQVMALASAKRCGLDIPSAAFDAPRQWLDRVSTSPSRGRYAHRRGEQASAAMTAEAMFVQQLLGRARTESRMQESAAFVLETPPRWTNGAPTYYWYYATLALFEHQGDAWRQWNERLVPELLKHQRTDGPAAGSWDPQDYWSRLGGRIYQTAVCTLSLEVYYRYRPAGVTAPATE